jgi:hypothetical protein
MIFNRTFPTALLLIVLFASLQEDNSLLSLS